MKEAKITPEEGPPPLPRNATTVGPWINVTSSSPPTTPKPSTQQPPKEEGKGPATSNETRVSRGGTINKPTSRHPPAVGSEVLPFVVRWSGPDSFIVDNPPASGTKITAEERREHRALPQEENDRNGLGVSLSLFVLN